MTNTKILSLLILTQIAFGISQNTQKSILLNTKEDEEECPVLYQSGSITVTSDNQIIENLEITANDSFWDVNGTRWDGNKWQAVPGVYCIGFKNVTIRNVYIKHYPQGFDAHEGSNAEQVFYDLITEYPEYTPVYGEDEEREHGVTTIPSEATLSPYSMGIYFEDCEGITIENVRVELVKPPKGALASWKNYNIYGQDSDNATIHNVIVSGGSSGIWLGNCQGVVVDNWAAYNVHGPFPRGQCLQASYCHDATISNFICKNQWQYSYPEDAMSLWRSTRVTVTNGVVIGNNATTGVGLMFEESDIVYDDIDDAWCHVQNVYSSGVGVCFSTYGGTNITWENCGCRDNVCGERGGREAGSSIMWYAGWENPSEVENCCYPQNLKVVDSVFWNACEKPWIWSDKDMCPDAWVQQDIVAQDFDLDEHPVDIRLCFQLDDELYVADTSYGQEMENIENLGLFGDGHIDFESPYDKDEVNDWGICDDWCYGEGWVANVEWERKCKWGKCAFCDECIPYWPFWVESNLAAAN